MTKVFVAGASGKQSGATTRALLGAGHVVHAYVRDTSSAKAQALQTAGAQLFLGDFDDTEALKRAMTGTTAIFFPSAISFTEADAEVRWARNILDAALAVGTVEHIVYSTVAGTESWQDRAGWDRNPFMVNYWRSKVRGEEMVRAAGTKSYTILKPVEFFENFINPTATFQLPDLLKDGVWRAAWRMGDEVRLIGTEDIGRIAAAVILDPDKHAGKHLELAAETLAIGDLMKLLSEGSGKTLRLQTFEPQEAIEAAKVNPVIHAQLMRVDSAVDLKEPEDYGFKLQSFEEFLTEHHANVVDTYKDVP